jgi:hypothetical protein
VPREATIEKLKPAGIELLAPFRRALLDHNAERRGPALTDPAGENRP